MDATDIPSSPDRTHSSGSAAEEQMQKFSEAVLQGRREGRQRAECERRFICISPCATSLMLQSNCPGQVFGTHPSGRAAMLEHRASRQDPPPRQWPNSKSLANIGHHRDCCATHNHIEQTLAAAKLDLHNDLD